MLCRILVAEVTECLVSVVEATRDTSPRIPDRMLFLGGVVLESVKDLFKDPNVVQVLLGQQPYAVVCLVPNLLNFKGIVRIQRLVVLHQQGRVLVVAVPTSGSTAALEDPVHFPPRGHGTKGLSQRKLSAVVSFRRNRPSVFGMELAAIVDIDAIGSGGV